MADMQRNTYDKPDQTNQMKPNRKDQLDKNEPEKFKPFC